MKKLALLLALVTVVTFAIAQDNYNNDEIQTIFSKRKSNGGYGAFSLGYTQIDGKDAFISGGRGAFIFDHSFALGAGGFGFMNNLDYDPYPNDRNTEYSLAGGYGGVFIEPIIAGRMPVHVSIPVLIGMGGIGIVEHDYWGWDWYTHSGAEFDYDLFFVLEPAVELEFNLARFFRTAAYVSYRYTSKIDLYETPEDVLRGLNFGLTFKFGKF